MFTQIRRLCVGVGALALLGVSAAGAPAAAPLRHMPAAPVHPFTYAPQAYSVLPYYSLYSPYTAGYYGYPGFGYSYPYGYYGYYGSYGVYPFASYSYYGQMAYPLAGYYNPYAYGFGSPFMMNPYLFP
jgi:hypothetical protein